MTDLYRIKPLEWDSVESTPKSKNAFFEYEVAYGSGDGFLVLYDSPVGCGSISCQSLQDGILEAEKHYADLMRQMLEPAGSTHEK